MKGCRSLNDKEIADVQNTLKSTRDKLLFILGVRTGLRIGELLSLKLENVLENGQIAEWVTVAKKNTKGKQESKTLPLTKSAKQAIKDYLYTLVDSNLNQPLFKSTLSDKSITRMQAHRILKNAFSSLNLKGNLSSHALRKSFAHRVHKALGERIEYTQQALSHKNINSTIQYLTINREEVEKAILGLG